MLHPACFLFLVFPVSLGLIPYAVLPGLRSRSITRISAAPQVDVDVAVVGAGPAGTTIAWLLQEQQKCKVAMIDPSGDSEATWYPNYGEWLEEWRYLTDHLQLPELLECTTNVWNSAEAFFGGSYDTPFNEKVVLDRPYVRVDRVKLQKLMRSKYKSAGGVIIPSKLSARAISTNLFDRNVMHNEHGSVLSLDDGTTVRCKVVVDASGFESKLVTQESPLQSRGHSRTIPLGYQIAYGIVAKVDHLGPYNEHAMTLFDYRYECLWDSHRYRLICLQDSFSSFAGRITLMMRLPGSARPLTSPRYAFNLAVESHFCTACPMFRIAVII
jgi:lycopene cyclase-like protein